MNNEGIFRDDEHPIVLGKKKQYLQVLIIPSKHTGVQHEAFQLVHVGQCFPII